MRRIKVLLAAALAALGLSGCFSSETALYGESGARCPFTRQTQFGAPTADVGGAIHLEPSFAIGPDGGACVRTGPGEDPTRLVFSPLAEGWYVVEQFKAENDRYFYGLVRIEGERVWSYQPNCGDFTAAALEQAGVESPWSQMFAPAEDGGKQARAPKPERVPGQAADTDSETSDGSCTVTSRAQVEALFRSWIRLGRAADSYGDRMPAP